MGELVYLVGCSDTKRGGAGPWPAQELYTGDLFRKARAFIERRGDRWFILSAKYGLLAPAQPITYYNLHLSRLPIAQRRAWGQRVRTQMVGAAIEDSDFIVFAGATYREALALPDDQVTAPLAGLGIGEQLAWFTHQP